MSATSNMTRRYIAEAATIGTQPMQHVARYAFPGGEIHVVRDEHGKVLTFADYDKAERRAMLALFEMLNDIPPVSHGKPERYGKITGPAFAKLLAEAGLTATFLGYLVGTAHSRIVKWMRGEEDVPHPVYVLLNIFKKHPETIDTAEDATEQVTEKRVKRADEPAPADG